jgi:hypothetical protein
MNEADLKEHEEMWTTKLDCHVLVDNRGQPERQSVSFSIFELYRGQLVYVLIEDNEIARIVAQRMLDAGVRVLPHVKDALALARSQPDKPTTKNG